jgi:hypothetical protein
MQTLAHATLAAAIVLACYTGLVLPPLQSIATSLATLAAPPAP